MTKHYMRSDNNGGLIISKRTMGTIIFFVVVIGFLLGIVTQVVAFNNRINTIENVAALAVKNNELIHPFVIKQQQEIAVLTEHILNDDKRFADMNTRLDRIEGKIDKLNNP